MLNLPINLDGKQKILICTVGGGFDIFGALPLYYTLKKMGKDVAIHSYSFSNGDGGKYHPEKFVKELPDAPRIYVTPKLGAIPLTSVLKGIVSKEKPDHIFTLDCGVDSLMFGNEMNCGTIVEEWTNFAALLDLPHDKTHVCLGFGTEVEEGISHGVVLENIANLSYFGTFLGTCCLTKNSESYKFYKKAYYDAINKEPKHKRSHIHPRVIHAVEGDFGYVPINEETIMDEPATAWISPLMGIMWFFNLNPIIKANRWLQYVKTHRTIMETIDFLESEVLSTESHDGLCGIPNSLRHRIPIPY